MYVAKSTGLLINSLSPGGGGFDFQCVIFNGVEVISAIVFRWLAQDPTGLVPSAIIWANVY